MKIALFSTKSYDRTFFDSANERFNHSITYYEPRLNAQTVSLVDDADAVCVFVNDRVDRPVLEQLAEQNVRTVALRCAGYNNVDVQAANELGVRLVRVPEYSPHAVAEHSIGLMLALNRRFHRAYNRVRDGDFRLTGLLGFDLYGKTVGVVGTGRIGVQVCRILLGFGCKVLAADPYENDDCIRWGVQYVSRDELFQKSSIIFLQCPLVEETHHLINADSIASMPDGVMLINTSRGAVIDTRAVIDGLKSHKIGALGIDVYEEEDKLFFEDLSQTVIDDDVFARLLTFPNVLITGHQGFFTREALENIASVTLQNLTQVQSGDSCPNEVKL